MSKEEVLYCFSSTCKNVGSCAKRSKPLNEIMKEGGKIVSRLQECYDNNVESKEHINE